MVELEHLNLSKKLRSTIIDFGNNNLSKWVKHLNVYQGKKVVISSNILMLFGFTPGSKTHEVVSEDQIGFRIIASSNGKKKVYQRTYKNREGVEALTDTRRRDLIASLNGASRVRVVIEFNEIGVKPILAGEVDEVEKQFNLLPDFGWSGIIDIIENVTSKPPRKLKVNPTNTDFYGSGIALLLEIQLRRLGYDVDSNDRSFTAKIGNVDKNHGNLTSVTLPPPKQQDPRFDATQPLSSAIAFSGGVDAFLLDKEGFNVCEVVEYRPQEKRDKTDKTELYAISCCLNNPNIETVQNVNAYELNSFEHSVNFAHISLPCTEFSKAKSPKDKQNAIDQLSTSIDLFIPVLRWLSSKNIPTLLVENVPDFAVSDSFKLFCSRLKQLGYKITHATVRADKYANGYTKRERLYLFASRLNADFNVRDTPIEPFASAWDLIKQDVDKCRDITDTKTIRAALGSTRFRPFTDSDSVAPTIMRSQDRVTKDGLFLSYKGRVLLPTIDVLKKLMSISDLDTSIFSNEISTEIVGQSICGRLHNRILKAVKQHLTDHASLLTQQPRAF